MKHVTVFGALAILPATVAGCSGHARPPGIVAGFAAHCAGPAQASLWPVRVSAREQGRTIASQVVSYLKDHDRYRLVLPAGRYMISARGSSDPPQSVVLRPGEHATINFPSYCY